ncbi:MAG: T9SS type A sorting domain-containing protein [Flavobacteriales bacterium]|nr:T9SS type A sorting domain-containing protein [Flavobacteriales bacterium]
MTNKAFVLLLISLLCAGWISAQEQEKDLPTHPEQWLRYQKERTFPPKGERGGGSLSLPFFDDFSRYSLPTDDPEIPAEWQRWEDDNVFINSNFPIQPPTVGVATFDGLKANGYPYNFVSEDAYGTADTLTSLPINLAGLDSADHVYLSFFFQAGGRGNEPDDHDSLVVEFFNPSGSGQWIRRWSTPGMSAGDFQRVFIPVHDATYGNSWFLDGFQFRFINYATLSGSTDHWHVDYVIMEANVDEEDAPIVDLAFMDPEYTMLRDYSAMPWTHFKSNPGLYLADTTFTAQRNLGELGVNFQSGYRVEYEDQVWNHPNDYSNTNGQNIINPQTYYVVNDDVFDTDVNDTCAYFTVKYYHELTDAVISNDTISFVQDFTNYYAYDDGSAERAYGLTVAGGQIALQYQLAQPDTLLGLFIHWIPFVDDVSTETFILRVWGNSGGQPGSELTENFGFNYPQFYQNGYNKFGYYEYDNPVPVDGTIYVGWVQQGDQNLNVGNDKNSNQNGGRLHYKLGIEGDWQSSSISGSLMIRPVFKAGKTNVWNSVAENSESPLLVYPNPAGDEIHIYPGSDFENYELRILGMNGQLIRAESGLHGLSNQSIADLPQGMYLIEAHMANGALHRERIVKQ